MPPQFGFSLAAVPLFIALNAFFVVGEYAVVAARPKNVQALRARGGRHARAARAMEQLRADPTGSIGAIQVCITMTNLMLGWIGEPAMSALLLQVMGPLVEAYPRIFAPLSTALSFIIVTLLTVVFSELLPKVLTLRYVDVAIAATASPLLVVKRVTFPLVWLMNRTANAVTRPLGLGRVDAEEGEAIGRATAEELRLLAEQLAADGTVSQRQRSLVLNALAMGRRTARQIMVPRVHITYLDLRWSMEKNLERIEGNLFSRLPLCDGGMDRVIGIVHAKEFFAAYQEQGATPVLNLIARPAQFVPEQASVATLIGALREANTQMLFVVDEHGGVEGLITLRDVVGELFADVAPVNPIQANA